MKFLIVGLGSMGKRRIRCLKALGKPDVAGFDLREDRRKEAETKYSVPTFDNFESALAKFQPEALIISVPPDVHHIYMKKAVEKKLPFFVEASVVDTDMEQINQSAQRANIIAVPSLTFAFHPAVKKIKELLQQKTLGKLSNVIYHSGSYLPEWHTYEHVKDYYVSRPETGGCREIVPFELSWITDVFGFPAKVCGHARKTIDIEGAERIDDTYNMLMDYGSFLATVTVDVVSRYANRRLTINGDKAQLYWSWDEGVIKVFRPEKKEWEVIPYEKSKAEPGYDPNIGEKMYIDEVAAFVGALEGKAPFPNTIERDHDVLKLLYAAEKADKTSSYVSFGK